MKARLLCVLVVGCSGDADPDAFIGTWRYNAGAQQTSSCPGVPTDLTGLQLFVHPGTDTDLLVGPLDCHADLTISGDMASASDKPCMQVASSGMGCRTHVITRRSFPFTLELDGSTLIINEHWSKIDRDTCGTRSCSGIITGTLTKED